MEIDVNEANSGVNYMNRQKRETEEQLGHSDKYNINVSSATRIPKWAGQQIIKPSNTSEISEQRTNSRNWERPQFITDHSPEP
jgi:hypothetical protein